jgi:choline dehydrogenase-like flavoprotein
VFDEPIHAHRGIPQSHECTEFLRFERGAEARVWIVPAFAHPIGFASTLPGFGAEHRRAMASYTHLAVVSAMVHDESFGRVRLRRDGSPRIHYELNEPDRVQLRAGLDACVRILFAAGAREVRIPAVPAVVLRSVRELDALDRSFVRPHGLPLTAVHPMGTLRMGEDPAVSAARSTGALHGLRGVFVADGSLFPTSLGVPPQISIYAFASKVAGHVLDAVRSSA